jgi:hypothetical protein
LDPDGRLLHVRIHRYARSGITRYTGEPLTLGKVVLKMFDASLIPVTVEPAPLPELPAGEPMSRFELVHQLRRIRRIQFQSREYVKVRYDKVERAKLAPWQAEQALLRRFWSERVVL